jgi:hypothetical protein
MAQDFLPRTDEGLLSFATPFSAKITATPTAFGVTAPIATSLAGKVTAYSTALLAAQDPATRGPQTIQEKNTKRSDLRAYIRSVAKQIQGTITVTDDQRQELGLTIRAQPSPIPVPPDPPVLEIVERIGTDVRIRLHDGTSTRRGRPVGVQGARVYSHVGPTPPVNPTDWTLEGQATRTIVDIQFPADTAPGTVVWLLACWYNPRGEVGIACAPVSTNISGGAVPMEEAA